MDITDNKYVRFVFNELGKVPGRRYSSMIHKKVSLDTKMPRQDKDRIETAIALLKMYGYVEEKGDSTPVMKLVLATEDKGNKVIEYGSRVDIPVKLLEWMPFKDDRKNHARLLYELTGDKNSFFPAIDESLEDAIREAGIQLPTALTNRIDVYEYLMQQTDQTHYENFMNSFSKKIESQGASGAEQQTAASVRPSSVTNVNINNPIVIGNMADSKIKTTDNSRTKNVIINGDGNQVVSDSKKTNINNSDVGEKPKQHWLQILYWVVGILVAGITIYKFFIA